jgi:hypothetical protein
MAPRHKQGLFYAAALAVLLGVFALYTRPEFLVNLADQLWSCF